jgi:asparagine synthase (glutamine-hydrolysing)
LIAKKFNTRHTSVELSPKDFLDEMPAALAAVDSPTGDGFNTYVVSKATKKAGITVALSGLGGDELFAGYPYFFNWLDIQRGLLPKIPRLFRRPLSAALSTSKRSKYQRIADILAAETLDLAGVYPMFRQGACRSRPRAIIFKTPNGRSSLEKMLDEKRDACSSVPAIESDLDRRNDRVHAKCAAEGYRPVFDGICSRGA